MRSVMWKVVCAAVLLTACGDESEIDPAAFEDEEDAAVSIPSDSDADGSVSATSNASDAGVTADAATSAQDATLTTDSAVLTQSDASTVSSDAGTQPDSSQPTNPCAAVYYRDADGDGFGDPTTALTSCSAPDGYVDNASDCYDANNKAFPGQKGRFSMHRGDGSFDYDCDGVQRLRVDRVAELPVFTGNECPIPPAQLPGEACDYLTQARAWNELTDGWWRTVPACGVQAPYGPDHRIVWNDDTRTYGLLDIGLPLSQVQGCN